MTILRAAIFTATMLVASQAAADVSKQECVDANMNGQNLRKEGKLGEARSQFLVCNDAKCPEIVRTDCAKQFEEVEAAAPAIIFEVKGSTGSDISAVKIAVDGKPLAEKADGTPLRVDPGSHEFTFEAPGEKAAIKKTFVLREGEKTRHEAISFAPDAPPPPPPPPPAPPLPKDDNANMLRITALGFGAAGVIGIVVGAVGGVEANSNWNDQKKDCASATSCKDRTAALSDHSATTTWGAVSTVGFIAGAALLAGGVVLYFLAPAGEKADKAAHLRDPLRFSF